VPAAAAAAAAAAAQFDYLGETTEGNLHLVQRLHRTGMVKVGQLLGFSGVGFKG
jgi:hypothetical protein